MKSIKGSKTAENLLISFGGEAQTQHFYNYYAQIARQEGYEQIANLLHETAENEAIHAKRFYDILKEHYHEENLEITAEYPIGIGSTLENLAYAIELEKADWSEIYPELGDIAEEEGFADIASAFRHVGQAEHAHYDRYVALYENLKNGRVFKRGEERQWKCLKCGYIHTGTEAPVTCPTCLVPQAYYELFCPAY